MICAEGSSKNLNGLFFTIPPMAVLLIGMLTACFANYGIISGQQFWSVAAHAALAVVTAAFFGGYKVVVNIVRYDFQWMWVWPLIWVFALQMIPNALVYSHERFATTRFLNRPPVVII